MSGEVRTLSSGSGNTNHVTSKHAERGEEQELELMIENGEIFQIISDQEDVIQGLHFEISGEEDEEAWVPAGRKDEKMPSDLQLKGSSALQGRKGFSRSNSLPIWAAALQALPHLSDSERSPSVHTTDSTADETSPSQSNVSSMNRSDSEEMRPLRAAERRQSIQQVAHLMVSKEDNEAFQLQALKTVLSLTDGREFQSIDFTSSFFIPAERREQLIKSYEHLWACGAVEASLRAMVSFPFNSNIQEAGCEVLSHAGDNMDVGNKIVEHNGVSTIIRAMKAHDSSEAVLCMACAALSSLAVSAPNRNRIAACGGIELVISALRKEAWNVQLQVKGLWALANLAFDSATNHVKIAKMDGIKVVMQAIENHREEEEVQRSGLAAVAALVSCNNTQNEVHVARSGGVESVVAALRAHLENPQVQANGLSALSNLAFGNNDNKKTLLLAKGFEAALAAIKFHSNNADVVRAACRLLRNAKADDKSYSAKFRATSGTSAVIAAMRRHLGDLETQSHVCSILSHLTFSDPDNRLRVAQCEGIAAVVTAMRLYEDVAELQEDACITLANIMYGNSKIKAVVKNLGGVELARLAHQKHGLDQARDLKRELRSWW